MDPKPHTLPPMKRFRLLHQDNHHHNHHSEPYPKPISKPSPITPSHLPAKKRKQSRFPPNSDENLPPPPPSITLPAKKRVWAFRPEISPTSPSPGTICLPAKKRVWACQPEISPTPSPICLPAKKRIWAFRPEPEFSPSRSTLSEIDLNVEYTPSPEKKKKEVQINGEEEGEESMVKDEIEREEEDLMVKDDNGPEEEEEEEDGILCAVCESTDGDPTDPIVLCDGCDLMVHATCYGNPLIKGIPEGDWFCSQCLNSRHSAHKETGEQENQRCCLCPVIGGATKQTNDGRWAHIVCAVLVPEVFFEDPEGRDGIDCSKVAKRRWKETCYLCKKTRGCAIECSEPKCPMSFHVTCGLKEDLCIELKQGRCTSNGGIVASFCRKHTEIWRRQQQTGKFKIVARD